MVHRVVYLVGRELMQDGHADRTVGESGKEGHAPAGAVPAADGNLVATLNTAVLEEDVQLLYFSGNVFVLQGCSLEICQCIKIPMVDDAFLDHGIKTLYLFH